MFVKQVHRPGTLDGHAEMIYHNKLGHLHLEDKSIKKLFSI